MVHVRERERNQRHGIERWAPVRYESKACDERVAAVCRPCFYFQRASERERKEHEIINIRIAVFYDKLALLILKRGGWQQDESGKELDRLMDRDAKAAEASLKLYSMIT